MMMIKSYNDDHNADYAYEYAEFKRTNFSTGDIDVAEAEMSSQMMVIIMGVLNYDHLVVN